MKNIFTSVAFITLMSSSAALSCSDGGVTPNDIASNNTHVAEEIKNLKLSYAGNRIEKLGLGEFMATPITRCAIGEAKEHATFIPASSIEQDFIKALEQQCNAIDRVEAKTDIGEKAKTLAKEGSLCDMMRLMSPENN